MRNFLLICLIGFSNLLLAQNWELFPFEQKSYYQRISNYEYLETLTQDSILNSSYYFNRKTNLDEVHNCLNELWQQHPYEGLMDSIIISNDTTYYYYSILNNPFYFLSQEEPGGSWIIDADNSTEGYSQIKISCTSKDFESVFGVMDSVKTYSLFGIGLGVFDNPLDTLVIKLSKSFGLIQYYDFHEFLIHPDEFKFTVNRLVGYIIEDDTIGYTVPSWKSFFNYQVNDIRFWKHTRFSPFNTIEFEEYYKEIFIDVEYTEDSIVYTFNKLLLDQFGDFIYTENNKQVLKATVFKNITNAVNDFYTVSSDWYLNYEPENNFSIWSTDKWQLDMNTIPGDTIIYLNNYDNFGWLDTIDCSISYASDATFSYALNSFSGIYQYNQSVFGFYPANMLIGYKIGDVTWGELDFPTEINQLRKNEIEIFPNPATNIIYTGITITRPLQYSIYNLQSQLINNGMLTENTISVSDITSGVYLLEIRDDENMYHGKFIKE